MKDLNTYLNEVRLSDLKVKGVSANEYNYHPKTNSEFETLLSKLIKERGNNADLNDIDTSAVTDMHDMFYKTKFNGDISDWDVGRVLDMSFMFAHSEFNGDISMWDVSSVKDMNSMFSHSKFNGDISGWDVKEDVRKITMFYECPLGKHLPKWFKSK